MKKLVCVLLICFCAASALSACGLFVPIRHDPRPTAPTAAPTADKPTDPAPTDARTDEPTAAPTQEPTQAPTQEPTKAAVGSLDSYVKTAKEATFTFDNGIENTYRLPEILLDSSDAAAANKEIMDRFGDDCEGGKGYSPVVKMDYEAYLSDSILGVTVTAKYDGGNSYGLCYAFDVTSGDKLSNEALCAATGRDYDKVIAALTDSVTAGYDERYGQIPGNDKERAKTLAAENIKAAKLYPDNSGKLRALVELYAAVGGGHWVDSFPAE